MDPPAARLYAVEPVGEDTMSPSPCTCVTNDPSAGGGQRAAGRGQRGGGGVLEVQVVVRGARGNPSNAQWGELNVGWPCGLQCGAWH